MCDIVNKNKHIIHLYMKIISEIFIAAMYVNNRFGELIYIKSGVRIGGTDSGGVG